MTNKIVTNSQKLMIISTINNILPTIDAIAVIGAVSRYPTWSNGNQETQRVLQQEVQEAFELKARVECN